MKERVYPYIGVYRRKSLIIYFTSFSTGAVLEGTYITGRTLPVWDEDVFEDITAEYLKNKKMRVENEDHARQVNDMAGRYGYDKISSDYCFSIAGHLYFNVNERYGNNVKYTGKDEERFFEEHSHEEIVLPFIEDNNTEAEEVMQEEGIMEAQDNINTQAFENIITKLNEKVKDLEHELDIHKQNTEQLAKLTGYISTNKNITGVAGRESVDVAIELIEQWCGWNKKGLYKQVDSVAYAIDYIQTTNGYEGKELLEAKELLQKAMLEIKKKEERDNIKVGDYVVPRDGGKGLEFREVVFVNGDELCIKRNSYGLAIVNKKDYVKRDSASE